MTRRAYIKILSNQPWAGRRALVSGGTSGLGLQLSLQLARQGAHLVVIGRDTQRLSECADSALKSGAASCVGLSIDIKRKTADDENAYRRLVDWLSTNKLDLLVNAVGRSDRGPLSHLASEDLVSQFADNVLCTWNMTRVALESIQSASGMIVNIGSLAGLIATPNMGGYCVSKFGLTALSRQLRVELASQNIGVMLAILGPIARSDSGFRYQELAKTRGLAGSSVNAPAGGAKLRLLDPIMVSQRILTAASRRQSELVLPSKAKYLAALAPLWPSLADRILSRYISSS